MNLNVFRSYTIYIGIRVSFQDSRLRFLDYLYKLTSLEYSKLARLEIL